MTKIFDNNSTIKFATKILTRQNLNLGRQAILRSLNAFPVTKDCLNLRPSECNECFITQALHLVDMSPVDILIRPGGNFRFSDFMMWETSQAYIHFIPETWPEFNFWKLVHAILLYQVHRKSAEKVVSVCITFQINMRCDKIHFKIFNN